MGLSLIAGFAFTLPAFADTNTNVSANVNIHGDEQEQNEGQKPPMMGLRGIGMMGKPAVVGTVSTVNGTTLTVSGRNGFMPGKVSSTSAATIFTVNASNAKVIKGNATSTVANISVGDVVVIQGTVSGTNINATLIRDGQMPNPRKGENDKSGDKQNALAMLQGNGQPVIAGTISVISGSTLTVTNKSNITYSVDVTNSKIFAGSASSTVSNLKVGDSVVVQGAVSGTSITASTVIDQTKPASDNGNQPNAKNFFGGIKQFFSHLFGF